jgi:hypothetical protein
MTDDSDGSSDARRPEHEVEASRVGRESMLARHKLIEAMIDNNMRQLKFDSARGGADIERACALRDVERGGGDPEPSERLAEIDRRIERLEDEHRSLDGGPKLEFKMDEISEALGSPMTPHL